MEELTIKKEEIEADEYILGITEQNDILVEDGIIHDLQPTNENNQKKQTEKLVILEDIDYDYTKIDKTDSTYSNINYAQFSDVSNNKINLDTQDDIDIADTYTHDKEYNCTKCRFSSIYRNSLKSHMLSVHNKNKPFQCSECEYSCSFKYRLTSHVKKVHEKERLFRCPECPHWCNDKINLKDHILTIHCTELSHKCRQCDYSCALKCSMKKHLRIVHNNAKKYNSRE